MGVVPNKVMLANWTICSNNKTKLKVAKMTLKTTAPLLISVVLPVFKKTNFEAIAIFSNI